MQTIDPVAELIAAAKAMLKRHEINDATYNTNIGLAQAADRLCAAIRSVEDSIAEQAQAS